MTVLSFNATSWSRPVPARLSCSLRLLPDPTLIGQRLLRRPGPEPMAAGHSRGRRVAWSGLSGPAVYRPLSAESDPQKHSRRLTPALGSRGTGPRCLFISICVVCPSARRSSGAMAQWVIRRVAQLVVRRSRAAPSATRSAARSPARSAARSPSRSPARASP